MEGCPRSLMLKLDLKESQITSFAPALKRYIRDFYQEDGESYSQECSQLEQLRTAVIKPTFDNSGCNLLRKYYGQIHLLKTRFPMAEGSDACVEFTWTDLYTEDPITLADITYEQSSVLFNLGALHSLLAAREDRVLEEGMKVACTHYQSSAGAFMYIKENFSTDQYSDTSKELLNLYINVMLGQAQECLLEKSMLDNRKNSLVARIAMQVQNYYTEAIACLSSSFGEILPPRMHKQWSKTLQIKCAYLNALAYMYMGNASDEQGKYGEKVAFLKIAAQKITEAQKLLKSQSQQMHEVVQFISDAVTQKLESAQRDNDFIYHEAEPASTALPEVKGASLVKPIPFEPYNPSMGKDIFERLIPMKAHESSSLYSEEKASLLRRYASIISEKDKELSSWLASMHIDDLLRPEEADDLPADLTSKCESLQSNPEAIKKSIDMLTKLKEKGTELERVLAETLKEVNDVQTEKKSFNEKYGVKVDDDQLKEFLDEVNSYYQKHMDGKKMNNELEKAFETHRHNLELMIGPEQALQGILPSHNILDSPIEDDAVQRIRDLLAKIEKMKEQRVQFMNKLREQVNKDDITHLIATRNGGDLQSLFKEELKKHNESCELLQCNLDAQDKIMKALTEANAKYADARRSVAEIKAKRDLVVKSLIGSYDFFIHFKDKVSSGVTFYNQISEMFEKRRPEIVATCRSEKERLHKIVEKAKEIKEERERKLKNDPVLLSTTPSLSNPGNPLHAPINPQQNPGNPKELSGNLQHPLVPHHSHAQQRLVSPHSPGHIGFRAVTRQIPPLQPSVPHSLRGPHEQGQVARTCQFPSRSGVAIFISRIPSTNLVTSRPRMSYPRPPFTSPDVAGPATSLSRQPSSGSGPADAFPSTTGNFRYRSAPHIGLSNVPSSPSMAQQHLERPQVSVQPSCQPMTGQYGPATHLSGQNAPAQSRFMPPVHQQQAQPAFQQRPAQFPPQQPETNQPGYQSEPPSYQQQFEIGPLPRQPVGAHQLPHGQISQQSIVPRSGQYQQPVAQQTSHQVPPQFQTRLSSPNQPSPGHQQTLLPSQSPYQSSTTLSQPSYHQVGPYQQQYPQQQAQQQLVSQHQQEYPDQRGPPSAASQIHPSSQVLPGPPQPNQRTESQIPPVSNPAYHQPPPHNLPPALEPQSYPKQRLAQTPSSENVPQLRDVYQSPQPRPVLSQESYSELRQDKIPSQPSQEVANIQQPLHTNQLQPTQSRDNISAKFGLQSHHSPTLENQYPSQTRKASKSGEQWPIQNRTISPNKPAKDITSEPGESSQEKPASGHPSVSVTSVVSKSSQEFSPTKVVLSKITPLSVCPVPPSSSYNESLPSDNSDHGGINTPKSTLEDKLLENLKSLDSPQALPFTQTERSTEKESADAELNVSGSRNVGVEPRSSQEEVQQLQQKVLLQQQQLIEQQQRFLEQQALGEQSQVRLLMEQIKQQQKELDDLRSEMKVKDHFGEIEKHLENLERRQYAVELSKTEAKEIETKSEQTEEIKTDTENGKLKEEPGERMNEEIQKGDSLVVKTSNDELNEITAEVESASRKMEDDILKSLTSTFAQRKDSKKLDDPPQTPSGTSPQSDTSSTSPSVIPAVDTVQDSHDPPPKPIKQRPPAPIPEARAQEVGDAARNVVSKPAPNAGRKEGDDGEYVLRLAAQVKDFRKIVVALNKRQFGGPSTLTQEWLAVQRYQDQVSHIMKCDVAKRNPTKNRYMDILPYDQSRVILQDRQDSDYINATMIENLTPLSPKYIASQGPIPQCFLDFWLMVWQQKCSLIIMLTKEVEGKKLKCHQYWPKDEGHTMLFGSLRVTLKRQSSFPFWKERIIHITHTVTHEQHILEHYQFTGWPDHGVPGNPSDFFTFMGHIYTRHQALDPDAQRPLLFHCSAGVGRTGAFIVIYSAMREMYSGNGIIDIQSLVRKLRDKRKFMVQKKEQYQFCYTGILYCAEQFLTMESSGCGGKDTSSSSDDTCSSDYDSDIPPPRRESRLVPPNQPKASGKAKRSGEDTEKEIVSGKDTNITQKTPQESNMGETKYVEITEEPDEVANSANVQCEDASCETAVKENAALIPGLQEIEEGPIQDDSVKNKEDSLAGSVEIAEEDTLVKSEGEPCNSAKFEEEDSKDRAVQ